MNARVRRTVMVLVLGAGLLVGLGLPTTAWATTITVTTTTDEADVVPNGFCSLREAIRNANADASVHPDCVAGSGADTIILPPDLNNDYALTLTGANEDDALNGDLDLTGTVTIQGSGSRDTSPGRTRIDALTLGDRAFHVQSGAVVTLSGINVTETNAGSGFGAGLLNLGGNVTMTDVWIYDSRSTSAGGIAIHNSGQMTLNRVYVDAADGNNGAAAITSNGTLTVSNSSITRGFASTGSVYGIRVDGGSATLSNVTIADSHSSGGAGVFVGAAGAVTLTNGTIVDNNAGLQRSGGTLTVQNTLIASNGPGANCVGTIVSGGYNLSDDASCTSFTLPGDFPANTDPRLGPNLSPRNNGSSTNTIALPPDSPAIDAGNPATPGSGGSACAAADQRGAPRPLDGDGANGARCDIGAYELLRLVVNATTDAVDATPGDGQCATAVPGQCTLRAAAMEAYTLGGAVIVLPASPTPYTLTRAGIDDTAQAGDLDLVGTTIIQGGGAASTIIDGGGLDRVFELLDGVVELSDLTVRNGNASGALELGDGGGIYVRFLAELTMRRSVVSGNHAARDGGGVAERGRSLVLVDSTIDANIANRDGGGLWGFASGNVSLSSSTFSANQASARGGGIFMEDSSGVLSNVTVSNNQAATQGGGLMVRYSGTSRLDLFSTTIAGNQAPTAAGVQGPTTAGSVGLRNTIVANNTGGDCISTRFTSAGYNLSSDSSCGFSNASIGDRQGVDPLLGPLADNGGLTRTRVLLFGSPAIDAGNPAQPGSGPDACPTTDQRGSTRPKDGDGVNGARCDIGAFELQDPYLPDLALSIADAPDPVMVGQALTYTVTVTNNGTATATGVALTDILPAGVTFGSANPSQGSCTGTSTIACSLGSLAVGAHATVTIVATPAQAGSLTDTANVSGSPTDSNPANNAATATTAAQANCQPRPNVQVTTSRGAAGQLNAAIAAQTTVGTLSNALSSIQFTRIDNAAVRLNGSPVAVGPAIPLASGTQQVTLLVERQAPGQNPGLATTVAFTVTDGCGSWPSFVGGGPGAF